MQVGLRTVPATGLTQQQALRGSGGGFGGSAAEALAALPEVRPCRFPQWRLQPHGEMNVRRRLETGAAQEATAYKIWSRTEGEAPHARAGGHKTLLTRTPLQ